MHEESDLNEGDDAAARRAEEAERARAAEAHAMADRVEQARSHPVRAAILASLAEPANRDGLTSVDVGDHLPEPDDGPRPLSAIVYHLRVLLGVELVTATDNPDAPGGRLETVWALP
jgi:hypothetical protein